MLPTLLLPIAAALGIEAWIPLNDQGNRLREQGHCRQAVGVLAHARSLAIEELGPSDPAAAIASNNLGTAYLCLGELTAAEGHFRDAIAALDAGPPSALQAGILSNFAILLTRLSRLKEAEQALNRALRLHETLHGPEHPQTAAAVNSLGVLRLQAGGYAEAHNLFLRAHAVWESSLGPDHLHTAAALNNLGAACLYLGDYERARDFTARALDLRRRLLPPSHPDIAQSLYNYAVSLKKLGFRKGAKNAFREAASVRRANAAENVLGVRVDVRALKLKGR